MVRASVTSGLPIAYARSGARHLSFSAEIHSFSVARCLCHAFTAWLIGFRLQRNVRPDDAGDLDVGRDSLDRGAGATKAAISGSVRCVDRRQRTNKIFRRLSNPAAVIFCKFAGG